jgi:hypothetical protein
LIVSWVCWRRRRRNSSATRRRPALIPSRDRSVTHGRLAELSTITRKERPSGIRPTSFCGRTPYAAPWIHRTAVRTAKTFQIVVRGRKVTASVDRVKPASLLTPADHQLIPTALQQQ